MTPARVVKRGGRSYAYYTCTGAQKRGWDTCPSKSVPAAALERFVLQQLLDLDGEPQGSPGNCTGTDRSNAEAGIPIDPDRLSATERIELVRSRVERVEYDGAVGKVVITVRASDKGAVRQET
jgi:hypothetical protein